MDLFIQLVSLASGAGSLLFLILAVKQLENITEELESLRKALENPAAPAQDAVGLLMEKLDATIGRTYASPPPVETPRRGRKPRA